MYSIDLGDIYTGLFIGAWIANGSSIDSAAILNACELADEVVKTRVARRTNKSPSAEV